MRATQNEIFFQVAYWSEVIITQREKGLKWHLSRSKKFQIIKLKMSWNDSSMHEWNNDWKHNSLATHTHKMVEKKSSLFIIKTVFLIRRVPLHINLSRKKTLNKKKLDNNELEHMCVQEIYCLIRCGHQASNIK